MVRKSVKINWNIGDIIFDRLFSDSYESIRIQVTDIDMNLNPETLDKIPIHVFSDSDKAGIVIDAIETQQASGLFETIFSLSSYSSSSGNNLFALSDDVIHVQYDDYTLPKPYGINDDLTIITEFTSLPLDQLDDKKIEWSQGNYKVKNGTGTAKIIVIDSDKNMFSDNIDTLQVSVLSDSYREGILLDLYETQKNTGIFERTFTFSDKRSAPSVLYAFNGDTVTAFYDSTLNSEPISMVATMFLGSTGPPLERVPTSHARITDIQGNVLGIAVVDEQALLTSDIANQMTRNQTFAWIVQVSDSNKKVQALSWIEGTLNPEESFSPTTSWIPKKEGYYNVVFFVWESITNPTALSPPIELDLTVLDESPIEHQYAELTSDELLVRQSLIEQLRTISRDEPMKNLTDTARDFLISETLKNNQISLILDDYTYNVECCSFSVDRQNPILNQHVGLKFHVEEMYLFVTVTYDLKQEKVITILKGSSDGFSIIPIEN